MKYYKHVIGFYEGCDATNKYAPAVNHGVAANRNTVTWLNTSLLQVQNSSDWDHQTDRPCISGFQLKNLHSKA
jgi:hypothetical protein